MDFKKSELYIFILIFIFLITGFMNNLLSKFTSSSIPILVIGVLLYLSYNFKTKAIKKTPLLLAILSLFFLIEGIREKITIPLGGFLIPNIPLLGFLIIGLFIYSIIIDYKKYGKLHVNEFVVLFLGLFILISNNFLKDKISGPIGNLFFGEIPVIGFLMLSLLIYLIYNNYKKYGRILYKTYFLSFLILLIALKDKLNILGWIENGTLIIFKNSPHALILGLIILFFINLLAYYILWGKKSHTEDEVF